MSVFNVRYISPSAAAAADTADNVNHVNDDAATNDVKRDVTKPDVTHDADDDAKRRTTSQNETKNDEWRRRNK